MIKYCEFYGKKTHTAKYMGKNRLICEAICLYDNRILVGDDQTPVCISDGVLDNGLEDKLDSSKGTTSFT